MYKPLIRFSFGALQTPQLLELVELSRKWSLLPSSAGKQYLKPLFAWAPASWAAATAIVTTFTHYNIGALSRQLSRVPGSENCIKIRNLDSLELRHLGQPEKTVGCCHPTQVQVLWGEGKGQSIFYIFFASEEFNASGILLYFLVQRSLGSVIFL